MFRTFGTSMFYFILVVRPTVDFPRVFTITCRCALPELCYLHSFLCLVLVELKALCYRAYVCVRNHPSVNTSESKEAKVSLSNRITLNITLPDVLVNKIQS